MASRSQSSMVSTSKTVPWLFKVDISMSTRMASFLRTGVRRLKSGAFLCLITSRQFRQVIVVVGQLALDCYFKTLHIHSESKIGTQPPVAFGLKQRMLGRPALITMSMKLISELHGQTCAEVIFAAL